MTWHVCIERGEGKGVPQTRNLDSYLQHSGDPSKVAASHLFRNFQARPLTITEHGVTRLPTPARATERRSLGRNPQDLKRTATSNVLTPATCCGPSTPARRSRASERTRSPPSPVGRCPRSRPPCPPPFSFALLAASPASRSWSPTAAHSAPWS